MTEATVAVQHFLLISLRGQAQCAAVPMASEAHARTTVAWAASEILRKSPDDRAFSWTLGVAGENVIVTPAGVGAQPTFAPIAAFDPREVVGVIYHQRKEGEKWE